MKIFFGVLVCLFLLTNIARAEQAGLGTSGLDNRNQAIAQASSNAMASILQQRLEQELGYDVLGAAWGKLSQEVFANPAPYISNFNTVAVNQAAGQTWVLVRAQVNEQTFAQLLGSLRGNVTAAPKLEQILCLVVEDVAPGRPALYWWSGQPGLATCPARIERGLKALGFAPINPGRLMANLTPDITGNVVLSEAQALNMAEQAGSKLALWGRIRAYPILSSSGSQSVPLVQLALLDTAQKRMLAQVEVEGAVFRDNLPAGFEASMDEEVKQALAKLFELAEIKIAPPTLYQITVEMDGIKSSADLARLETALLRMHEVVVQVKRGSISSGKATLLVSASQDGVALAEELLREESFSWLRVEERAPTRLRVAPVGR